MLNGLACRSGGTLRAVCPGSALLIDTMFVVHVFNSGFLVFW